MLKEIYQIVLIYFIGLWIVSCKKDVVPEETNNSSNSNNVYAGVEGTTFNFHQLQTPLSISILWDSQNLYGVGKDSLDLDSDGLFDLVFTLNVLNEDSLHLVNGTPNPFPSCKVNSKNGYEIAFYIETYPIGLGQTATTTFADRIDLNERIDLISEWDSNLKMWAENPGGSGTPPFGDWYSATTENYLGIRSNNKYGWVEINASNPKKPQVISFAIQE